MLNTNYFQTSRLLLLTLWAFFFLLSTPYSSAQKEKTLFKEQRLKSTGGWGGYRSQVTRVAGQTGQISFKFGWSEDLELVRDLDFGLQPANFISSSVKIFAGSPAYDCKFRLA